MRYQVTSSQQVRDAVLHLLPSQDEKPPGVEGLRIFLLLSELVIQINKKSAQSTELAEKVAAAIQRLSDESRQVIGTVRECLNVLLRLLLIIGSCNVVLMSPQEIGNVGGNCGFAFFSDSQ